MKLSMNLINHLNKKGTFNEFLSEYNAIHEKYPAYANTFAGMLEIARGLDEIEEDYLVIGGLSVAAYLHQADSQAFKNWRGSSDIDLVVPNRNTAEKILNYSGYKFAQIQRVKEGMIGRLYDYVKQDNGEPTVVGLRTGICDKTGRDITKKLLNHRAVVPVHGVEIAVPRLKDLVDMKHEANRKKDRLDIKTLREMIR